MILDRTLSYCHCDLAGHVGCESGLCDSDEMYRPPALVLHFTDKNISWKNACFSSLQSTRGQIGTNESWN